MFNQTCIAQVVGIQKFGWTDRATGERREGVNVHCSFKADDIAGTGATSVFMMRDYFERESINPGSKILIRDAGRDGYQYIGGKSLLKGLE